MNTRNWAVSILSLSIVFSNAALSQGQTRQCSDIHPTQATQEEHNRLKDLFRYSQIAERPKHDNNEFMENCPRMGTAIVEAPGNITPLNLSDEISHIEDMLDEMRIEGAYLEPADDGDGGLAIGCKGEDGRTKLPINIKVNTYISLVRDLLSLDFSFSAEIANRDEYENITTRAMWAPYVDEESDMIVYSMRGTDPWDVRQILTNYVGHECAFPAMRIAVSHVCFVFDGELRNGFDGNRFSIEDSQIENIRDSIRRDDNIGYSTVLAGHSLGGQAAQYVAENPPRTCLPDSTDTHGALRTYAFASTRNHTEGSIEDDGQGGSGDQSIVESYVISGDQILDRLELGQEQTGRVTTYLPDVGSRFESRHSIDEIQDSICDCLEDNGQVSIREASNS